ncbi:MAG: hypothetical protein J6A40_05215 [Bacteroides sp.]|nr:hypothetical protein [Bacteroides sp.]
MKKIFFALAALVLAFTGCSQEEDAIQVSEKKAIKVVVNMDKPGFGEDTRAARTEWEDGDQVIGTIGSPGIGILLTYNSGSWTTELLKISNTNKYVPASSADLDEMLETGTVNVKAAYFSSKIKDLTFVVSPTTSYPTMIITTNASGINMGECVMTCVNGTCKVEKTASEYVLTLDILMIPQVAQYTIRNLNVADEWYISMGEMSPINMYAGGAITPTGVDLNLIVGTYNAYPHQNGNDISIFAAPWQSNADIPSVLWATVPLEYQTNDFYCTQTFYAFTVDGGGEKRFGRTIGYKAVEIGGAVIMDGPYTDGAEDKWDSQEK